MTMETQTRKPWRRFASFRTSGLLAGIILGASGYEAAAQPAPFFDHLKCYRVGIKADEVQIGSHAFDPLTLTPYQVPPFDVEEGCQLLPVAKPRPTHVCIPVDKQPRQSPRGSWLGSDYLLYRMRCPEESDVRNGFVDQFVRGSVGIRRKVTTRLLLVPAYASETPSSPCEPTAPNQCGGSCPNFDELCQIGPNGTCGCVQQAPCGGDPVGGECNGACEPGAICLPAQQGGLCACLR
jgi:hypothetical protein